MHWVLSWLSLLSLYMFVIVAVYKCAVLFSLSHRRYLQRNLCDCWLSFCLKGVPPIFCCHRLEWKWNEINWFRSDSHDELDWLNSFFFFFYVFVALEVFINSESDRKSGQRERMGKTCSKRSHAGNWTCTSSRRTWAICPNHCTTESALLIYCWIEKGYRIFIYM